MEPQEFLLSLLNWFQNIYFASLKNDFNNKKLLPKINKASWEEWSKEKIIEGNKVILHEWNELWFSNFIAVQAAILLISQLVN